MPKLEWKAPVTTFDEEPLELPALCVDGEVRVYKVQTPSGEEYRKMYAFAMSWEDTARERKSSPAVAKVMAELEKLGIDEFRALALGADTAAQMNEDGVLPPEFEKVTNAAITWFISGQNLEATMQVFDPKVPPTDLSISTNGEPESSTPTTPTATRRTRANPAPGRTTKASPRTSNGASQPPARTSRRKTSGRTPT